MGFLQESRNSPTLLESLNLVWVKKNLNPNSLSFLEAELIFSKTKFETKFFISLYVWT